MSYRLFLDDYRDPKDVTWLNLPLDSWVIVRSYDEFVKTITERGRPDFITFDHDLTDEQAIYYVLEVKRSGIINYEARPYKENTGLHCAEWLIDYCLDNHENLPLCTVHSANHVGAANINKLLNNFKQFKHNEHILKGFRLGHLFPSRPAS